MCVAVAAFEGTLLYRCSEGDNNLGWAVELYWFEIDASENDAAGKGLKESLCRHLCGLLGSAP